MASQLVTRSCAQCQAPFEVRLKRIDYRPGWGRFCSKNCAIKFNRGPAVERFWARVNKTDDCWLWTGAQIKGYGDLRINTTARQLAHRFSWELHSGHIPQGLHVLHRCDNPPCVRPDHLFLGTNNDNVMDMVVKGRAGKKLSPEIVVTIRREYASSQISQRELAIKYGVSKTTMEKLLTWKTWGHL